MSKRILVSAYTFVPDVGGVATNKVSLCRALVKAGYDVGVVTLTPGGGVNEGYPVYRNPNPWQLFCLYLQADVIYLANCSVKLGWPVIFVKSSKVGLCHHAVFGRSGRSAFNTKIFIKHMVENIILRKSFHFPNSVFTQDASRRFITGRGSAVAYPIAHHTEVAVHNLKTQRQRKDAFFAGRLVEEKGAHFLLENWTNIRKTLGVENIYIAGHGPDMERLEGIIKTRKLKGVHLLGKIPLEDVVGHMRKAAFVFIPSLWEEPFGNVGVEGLAAGAVVVSSDRGGLPEAVGDVGVLFNFDEPESFPQALVKAKTLWESLCDNSEAFESYRRKVRRHLGQFKDNNVLGVIVKNMGLDTARAGSPSMQEMGWNLLRLAWASRQELGKWAPHVGGVLGAILAYYVFFEIGIDAVEW